MSLAFVILAALVVCSAVGAMFFRNPVHCALSLAITFISLAGLFLRLNAQFVGLTQILVYVGAVAILIVFAILLTRSGGGGPKTAMGFRGNWIGIGVASATFVTLWCAILASSAASRPSSEPFAVTVKQIGQLLLAEYVLPLELIALLLTAAMIGAVLIAMRDRQASGKGGS